MPPAPLTLVAAAALIDADGRVLIQQRPVGKSLAGLWEFPGGKIEAGETPEVAVIRELNEELGIDVTAACLAPGVFASATIESGHLLMLVFLCRKWRGQPQPLHAAALRWCRPAALFALDMPAPDRPLIGLLDALI